MRRYLSFSISARVLIVALEYYMQSWPQNEFILIPDGQIFSHAEWVCTPEHPAVKIYNIERFTISQFNVIGPYIFTAVKSVSSLPDRWYRPNSKKVPPKLTLLGHTQISIRSDLHSGCENETTICVFNVTEYREAKSWSVQKSYFYFLEFFGYVG